MFLKGGTLMGVVYQSPRQTTDIDFTAGFDPCKSLIDEFQNDLDAEMKQASAILGYPDLVCRIQSLKMKPRPQGFEEKRFPAIEMKIGYARRESRQYERLKRGDCPDALKIEVSFKEPVEAIELVQLGKDASIHAYGLPELISEKIRALLQQAKLGKNRRQDVYDIAFLVKHAIFEDSEKQYMLERLIKKSKARDIIPEQDSLELLDVKERAREGWETLSLELSDLPDFEEEFELVESFYKSLPWHK